MDHVDQAIYQVGPHSAKKYTTVYVHHVPLTTKGLSQLIKFSKRMEMKTFMKILSFSYEHGPQKKTNMATNCKMSYTRFIPILNLMILFDLLEMQSTSDKIMITEYGKTVLEKLQNV